MSDAWDTCNMWARAQMIAYSQIREYEDSEEHANMLKASGANVM